MFDNPADEAHLIDEEKLNDESRSRLTADMFYDIYKAEKHNINHRMRFI